MITITRRQLVGLVLLTLMWGLNWPIMKFSLRELPPLHFRAATMVAGALVLAAWYARKGVRLIPRGASEWRDIVVLGLPNILGWHALSIIGVAHLPAGRAAILGFTMPVWTVLLGVTFYREHFTRRLTIAVGTVLAGITLLLWDELAQIVGRPVGIAWMQAAAFCWALGTIWMRRACLTIPEETLVIWMMLLSAAAIQLLGWWLEPTQSWDLSTLVWVSLVWSALINYGAAQVIWFSLARALPSSTSAMSVMAVPMVGVLGSPMIGEWPRWQDLVAMLCVAVAIWAVLRAPANPIEEKT